MKNRGKAVEISDGFPSDPPCRKHPSSSSVGICAFCLKDRLIKLVCSDCGEPRLSSCSCSDISNRNSVSVDVGSVGPISFLIHNDKPEQQNPSSSKHTFKPEQQNPSSSKHTFKPEQQNPSSTKYPFKRSSSASASEKRNSFWHLGWFSKKKPELGAGIMGRSSDVCDRRCEIWDFDHLGPSGSFSFEAKRSSSTRPCEPGSSFSLDRGELESEDGDSGFFDLKFGRFSSDTKPNLDEENRGRMLGRGSSCRITVKEKGIKGSKKGSKVWKWIFTPSSGRSAKK
ncbi:hypothetical protein H6P81_008652 [Aristolochia fimbriata]|uniref:Uncharacterized protein n=1 Tax=Aristolochia fimbriata TaxID=158543 RepID=A0AAV7EIL8_ARIFI|nr:hypothetical protein H6P81_008652 [Aristolochia fimbriata]